MLQQHQLPESPGLSSHTVRSMVKHLYLHQAVFASKLFRDSKFQAVPTLHFKGEVTGTVVEHCSSKIRLMLETIDAIKLKTKAVSADHDAGDDDVVLDPHVQREPLDCPTILPCWQTCLPNCKRMVP
jgi:hypothetical protein